MEIFGFHLAGLDMRQNSAVHADVVGEEPAVEYLPARRLDVPVSVLDVGRASENLGWHPVVGLPEGIARTWDWIRTLPESRVESL